MLWLCKLFATSYHKDKADTILRCICESNMTNDAQVINDMLYIPLIVNNNKRR